MNKITVAAMLVAASMLSGCATNVGTQAVNDFGRFQALENGKTTKQQVYQSFGQPHVVTKIDQTGETLWRYLQVTSRMNPTTFIPFVGLATGGNDLNYTLADFYFDREDKLEKTQREQRAKYVNQWVGIGDAMTPSRQVAAVEAEMNKYGLAFDKKTARLAASWADAVD